MTVEDDDLVRRAAVAATAARVHVAGSLIGEFRAIAYLFERHGDIYRDNIDAARRRLIAFLAHGDAQRAKREIPAPPLPQRTP